MTMSKAVQSMTNPNTVIVLLLDGVYHTIEVDSDHDQVSVRSFDTTTMEDETESWVFNNFTEKSELMLRAFATIQERVKLNKTRVVYALDNSKPADIYDPLKSDASAVAEVEIESFYCLKCGHDVSTEADASAENRDSSFEFTCSKCGFISHI